MKSRISWNKKAIQSHRFFLKEFKPFVVMAGLFLSVFSCTEDPPPTLFYQDRERIDSMFFDSVNIARPILDSLCVTRHDSLLSFFIDSLLEARQNEIETYLNRIESDEEF